MEIDALKVRPASRRKAAPVGRTRDLTVGLGLGARLAVWGGPAARRRYVPQSGRPIICRFYFLDGNVKAIGINSYTTAQQAIKDLAKRIDLPDPAGWSIYEVFPDHGTAATLRAPAASVQLCAVGLGPTGGGQLVGVVVVVVAAAPRSLQSAFSR